MWIALPSIEAASIAPRPDRSGDNERRSAPGPVFARVEAGAAKRVSYLEMSRGGAVCIGSVTAFSSARFKASGNARPLRAARARIPAQARALKKYRCGTLPGSTSTADNEHALASLGQSEVLSVQDSVGPPIPELAQPSEEGTKGSPLVCRQDTGDILPNDPAGSEPVSKAKKLERQLTTRVIQAASESGEREGLAGSAPDENIDSCFITRLDLREVAEVRNTRPTLGKHAGRERGDLGEERVTPSERMPRERVGRDPAAHRADDHVFSFPHDAAAFSAASRRAPTGSTARVHTPETMSSEP